MTPFLNGFSSWHTLFMLGKRSQCNPSHATSVLKPLCYFTLLIFNALDRVAHLSGEKNWFMHTSLEIQSEYACMTSHWRCLLGDVNSSITWGGEGNHRSSFKCCRCSGRCKNSYHHRSGWPYYWDQHCSRWCFPFTGTLHIHRASFWVQNYKIRFCVQEGQEYQVTEFNSHLRIGC